MADLADDARRHYAVETTRQLAQRVRAGLLLILLGIALYVPVDLILRPDALVGIYAPRTYLVVALVLCLIALRVRSTRRWTTGVGLAAVLAICFNTAQMGVLVGEAATMPILAMTVVTASASLVPWGLGAHAVVVVAATAGTIWNVYAVTGRFPIDAYASGAVAFVFVGSFYVVYELRRNRLALAQQQGERLRTEEDLRQSQERFALATRGTNDGIWDWNLRANQIYYSPRWKSMLGYDDPEIEPRVDEWRQRIHPDDQRAFASAMSAHMRGHTPYFEVEHRVLHRDGTYRWMLARGQATVDDTGKAHRITGSLTDLTDRKRAEEAARQHQAELAHVARLGTMGGMAAGLAHELNQPLAAIVSYARGCIRRIRGGAEPPELIEALEHIATQAVRAGEVIRRIRNFARKEEPKREPVDVNELVREAVRFSESEARKQEVAIRLSLTARLPLVEADSVQVEQVLINLLRNAFDATRDSDSDRAEVLVETALDGRDGVVVRVRDWGKGILPAIADRVFDPFFTTKPTGLGMGLSISRSLIEAHGGRLWATPNPDRGTTFHFTLPLATGGRSHAA
jgi:PAS domain S-box-containing protein